MADRIILWAVTDPRGLNITLTGDVWDEHVSRHPELVGHVEDVKICVQDPDEIYFDPVSTATKNPDVKVYFYYKRGLLSDKFEDNFVETCVKVVVENNIEKGYVQSVIFPNDIRKRLVAEWKK